VTPLDVPSKFMASTVTLVSEAATWCRILGGVLVDLATNSAEKLGWDLFLTCLDGSVPLWGSSSSGELGALILVASDSLVFDDVMASGHLFQPVVQWLQSRSGSTCYTGWQQKTVFLRRRGGRLQAVCSGHRWRGRPGGVYKDRIVIFFSFMGVLIRFGL
jgi:hypothetical protein